MSHHVQVARKDDEDMNVRMKTVHNFLGAYDYVESCANSKASSIRPFERAQMISINLEKF